MAQPVPQHLLNAQQQQQMLSMNPLPGYTPYNSNNRGVSQLQYEQTQQRHLQHQLQQQQAYLQSQQYQQQQSLLRQQMADSRIKTLATSGMNELIPLGRAGGSSSNHSSKVSSNQGSRVPSATQQRVVQLDPSPEANETPISPPSTNASRLGEIALPILTKSSHSRDSSPESSVPLSMRKDIERRTSSSSSSQASTSKTVVQKFPTATIDYPPPKDKTFYADLLAFHSSITKESIKNSGYTYHFNNSYATRVALVCSRMNEINCKARVAVMLQSTSNGGGWILDGSYTTTEHTHGVHPEWQKNHNWKPDARGPIRMAERELSERARMEQNKGKTIKRTVNIPVEVSRAATSSKDRLSSSRGSGSNSGNSLAMPQVGDLYPTRHAITIAASYAAHQLGYSFIVTKSPGTSGVFQLGCRRSCAPTPVGERCSAELVGVKQPDGQWEVTRYKFNHNHKKEPRKKWTPPSIPKEEANLVTAKDVSKYRTVSEFRSVAEDDSSEAEESDEGEEEDSEGSGESGSESGSEVGSDRATSAVPEEEDNRRKKRRQRQLNNTNDNSTRSFVDLAHKKPKRSISPARRSSTSQPKRALSPSLDRSTSKRRSSLEATPPPPAFTLPPLPSSYESSPNKYLSIEEIGQFLYYLNPKFLQWSSNFFENGVITTETLSDLIMTADEFLGPYLVEIGIPSLPRILIANKFRELRTAIDQ